MTRIQDLKVKIFADGADLTAMLAMAKHPHVQGLTTNPSLMRKSGVTDYEGFARQVLADIRDKPVSFEVFADTPREMIAGVAGSSVSATART